MILTDKYIQKAKKQDFMIGILYIDLDLLKLVNDYLGHEYGDEMIIEASNRILECIKNTDTLARSWRGRIYLNSSRNKWS